MRRSDYIRTVQLRLDRLDNVHGAVWLYDETVIDTAKVLKRTSLSSVTNSVACDAYRRAVVQTDGRGNATTNAYDSLGRLASVTDATSATTSYAYDSAGRIAAVTNALGVATVYEYDVRGNKTYEGGGTYPVSYAYDAFNVMTNMTTYRAEGSQGGDTTSWAYDEATGLLLAKTYADGHGPTYTYTDDGNISTRTWARGVVTTYAYDGWNQLVSTTYSDDTPSISLSYDAMGRQISATDAAGTTLTTYNNYGETASESTSGLYSRTVSHVRDVYGRDLGYTLNNSRKNIIEYEEDTGRTKRVMFAGAWYTYSYLPGTDLKSALAVGTAGRTDWTYEPTRDLLTQVKNTAFGSVVSQYDYVNDAVGRRTEISRSGSRMSEFRTDAYGYNDRNELTNAVKNATLNEYAYQYDDIGNRLTSLDLGTNRTYVVNNLNQYTSISNLCDLCGYTTQYDLDGNQTLIKTPTGIWSVTYNGENRPVLWVCGSTNITMKFDRMGRRVEYVESVDGVTNRIHRFVYDGYLCIQRLDGAANNAVDLAFGWDPTEPVATRPLWMQRVSGTYNFFYFHDGNKNVSDLVSYQSARGVPAHYEYAPFGTVTAATTNTVFTPFNVSEVNPFRFSSEYADDALGLIYYNYRHYEPIRGRWACRDALGEFESYNLWSFLQNNICFVDWLGLAKASEMLEFKIIDEATISFFEVENISVDADKQRVYGLSMSKLGWDALGLTENFINYNAICKCLRDSASTGVRYYIVGTLSMNIKIQYVGEGRTVTINGPRSKKSRKIRTKNGEEKTIAHEKFHAEYFAAKYRTFTGEVKRIYSPAGYSTMQECDKVRLEISRLVEKKKREFDKDKSESNHSSKRWKEWFRQNGGPIL